MGSAQGFSRVLLCSTAFVLVLLSSASKDERDLEQRDVTFDFDKIMQEMQQPDSFMMQKEVDLSEFLDTGDFQGQVIVSPDEQYDTLSETGNSRPRVPTPRGRRPNVRPRTFGGPPSLDYRVEFPVARPSSDNLEAICLHGDRRPTYPSSYFPTSGFGQLKRRARAVNNAEAWFRTCCKGNETWGREMTLCCATQAWKLSVQSFCAEDTSVKDRIYDCCRQGGSDRLNCFHNDAPNPNYEPTLEVPMPPLPSSADFSFDPNTCQRRMMTPYSITGNKRKKEKKLSTPQKVDIKFPPGRPTADAIDSLCHNQKLRPLFTVKCLSGVGNELLARQAKTINRIEKGFKQCCKKKQDVLNCADQEWRDELNRFCVGQTGEQVDFQCCSTDNGANDRFSCFQNMSPDPHYNMTSPAEGPSLSKICDTHKIIKKKFSVGFPVKSFVTQCCPLPDQEKTSCLEQRLKETSGKLCSSKKSSPPTVRRCCRESSEEAPQCISKILLGAITKATNVSRQKKCPVS